MALAFTVLTGQLTAAAADLTLELKTPGGAPVRDAVVAIYPAQGPAPGAASRLEGPFKLTQQGLLFHPYVLVVPVGATVGFPNLDKVRHHVYSFSTPKKFELKLYGQDEKRVVVFDKAGIVAVGCNIHDKMAAFIDVVDTPYVARSDERGHVEIHDAPDGAATVKIWHPYLKAVGQTLSRPMTLRAGLRDQVVLDLREPPAGMQSMGD